MRLAEEEQIAQYASREDIFHCVRGYFEPLAEEYRDRQGVLYLCNVAVREDRRGEGIGRQLMEYAAKRWQGRTELDVLCDNPAAIHLYESTGFHITDQMDAFSFIPIEDFKSYKMVKG